MTQPRVKVLLVEESPSDARLIQHALLQHNPSAFEVFLAGRLDDALARLQQEQFDVVLLDLGLPDWARSAFGARPGCDEMRSHPWIGNTA